MVSFLFSKTALRKSKKLQLQSRNTRQDPRGSNLIPIRYSVRGLVAGIDAGI
jgi:hypothetical protein